MKSLRFVKGAVVALASIGLLLPQVALAGQPQLAGSPQLIGDIELGDGGILAGQVVDAGGNAVAGMKVTIRDAAGRSAETATTADGYFAVSGLRGATYLVETEQGSAMYRAWTKGTAPPVAQKGVLMVVGNEVVRGQGPMVNFLTNPWVVASLIAAAIAIPIATSNDGAS